MKRIIPNDRNWLDNLQFYVKFTNLRIEVETRAFIRAMQYEGVIDSAIDSETCLSWAQNVIVKSIRNSRTLLDLARGRMEMFAQTISCNPCPVDLDLRYHWGASITSGGEQRVILLPYIWAAGLFITADDRGESWHTCVCWALAHEYGHYVEGDDEHDADSVAHQLAGVTVEEANEAAKRMAKNLRSYYNIPIPFRIQMANRATIG